MNDLKQCKCGAKIIFMRTKVGKIIPVNFDVAIATESVFDAKTMIAHFAMCPNAQEFRKNKKP